MTEQPTDAGVRELANILAADGLIKMVSLKIAEFCNGEGAWGPAVLPNSSSQKPWITPSLPDTLSFLNQSQDWLNTMKAHNFILQSFYVCSGAEAFRTFISRHCGWETYSFKNKVRFSGSNLCAAAIVFRKNVQTKSAKPVTAHRLPVCTRPYAIKPQSGWDPNTFTNFKL